MLFFTLSLGLPLTSVELGLGLYQKVCCLLQVWFPCDISGSFQFSHCLWNGKLTNCYLWELVGFRLVPSKHTQNCAKQGWSSLGLILKLNFTCLIVLHLRLPLFFCQKYATSERAGILLDPWISSFLSASKNIKRLGIQCYAEHYKFAGAMARRDNYDNLFWPSASCKVPPVVFIEVHISQFNQYIVIRILGWFNYHNLWKVHCNLRLLFFSVSNLFLISHLSLFNFCFMSPDVALLSPVPIVGRCSSIVSPCRPLRTAVNFLLFLLNHLQSQVYISELHSFISLVFIFSALNLDYTSLSSFLWPVNHYVILKCWCHFKYSHWNSCGLHSLYSFVRPTYKISSFTLRCIIHIGLNGNTYFTQEWQDQTLNWQAMPI